MNEPSIAMPEPTIAHPLRSAARSILPLAICYAVLLAPIAYLHGANSALAAGAAALVCLISSGTAAFLSQRLDDSGQPIGGALASSVYRMLLPLGFCVVVGLEQGRFYHAGAVWYLVGFYALALVLDTFRAIARVKARNAAKGRS